MRPAFLAAVLTLAACLAACLAASAQSAGGGAADEIRVVEIVVDASLSAAERGAIAQAWSEVARTAPRAVANYEGTLTRILAEYGRAAPQGRAGYRTLVRRGAALGECAPGFAAVCSAEAPLFEAHDPAVVVDRERRLVFTRASIAALVAGARTISSRIDVPPPGDDAADLLARALRTRDAQGQIEAFDVMQDAARNVFNLPLWNREAQPAAVNRIHGVIAGQANETDRVFFLAQAAALVGKRAGEVGSSGGGGGGPGGMMAGAMRSQAMGMMARSLSQRCMGVGTGGNVGYCSGN